MPLEKEVYAPYVLEIKPKGIDIFQAAIWAANILGFNGFLKNDDFFVKIKITNTDTERMGVIFYFLSEHGRDNAAKILLTHEIETIKI